MVRAPMPPMEPPATMAIRRPAGMPVGHAYASASRIERRGPKVPTSDNYVALVGLFDGLYAISFYDRHGSPQFSRVWWLLQTDGFGTRSGSHMTPCGFFGGAQQSPGQFF